MASFVMSTETQSYDSLPYIDAPVTDTERNAAGELVQREMPNGYQEKLHPSLAPLPDPNFTKAMQAEIDRCAKGKPFQKGIDLTRYEEPDEPEASSDIKQWRAALRNSYLCSSYLAGRRVNLALLEDLGKNAWLIGNSEMEDILKRLEREVAGVKAHSEEVNKARKTSQEGSKGELDALEDTWRKGIAKMIEVQIATEQLKIELQQRRRDAVSANSGT